MLLPALFKTDFLFDFIDFFAPIFFLTYGKSSWLMNLPYITMFIINYLSFESILLILTVLFRTRTRGSRGSSRSRTETETLTRPRPPRGRALVEQEWCECASWTPRNRRSTHTSLRGKTNKRAIDKSARL